MVEVSDIERKIDRAIAAPIVINADLGGVALETMGQMMEFAKLMAVSGSAVPKYLRHNPGGCLAICSRALRWHMDPFALAEKSYQVINKGEERIAFEAQAVHAVITANAPLKARLRYEIVGTDDERRCKVWGTFRGEHEPHVYTSEPLGKIKANRPKRREGDGFGGSPLWDTNPEVQLAYSAVRQWCRLFSSETLLGVYTPDELEDDGPVDVTPITSLANRLRDAKLAHAEGSRGFDAAHIAQAGASVIEGEATSHADKETGDDGEQRGVDQPHSGERGDEPQDRGDDPHDEGRGGQAGGTGEAVRGEPAGADLRDESKGEAQGEQPARSAPKPRPRRK
jgi:RecT family